MVSRDSSDANHVKETVINVLLVLNLIAFIALVTVLALLFFSPVKALFVERMHDVFERFHIEKESLATRDMSDFVPPSCDYSQMLVDWAGNPLTNIRGSLKLMIDPFTNYRNLPNQETACYTIDEHGFRGGFDDNDEPRIVVVGGSAVFGYGLDSDDQTLPARLEMVNPGYEVINGGVTGILSGEELALISHYFLDYDPSVVIAFDGWNDVYGPINNDYPVFMMGGHIDYYNLVKRLRDETYLATGRDNNISLKSDSSLFISDEDEYWDLVYNTYIKNVLRMDAISRGSGVRFAVIFQPDLLNKKHMTPHEEDSTFLMMFDADKMKMFRKRYSELRARSKEVFLENNITFLDINEMPEYTKSKEKLHIDPVHLNENGTLLVAKLISSNLDLG